MGKDPRVYIAVEGDGGQLVIDGPLSLLERFIRTLQPEAARAVEVQEDGERRQAVAACGK